MSAKPFLVEYDVVEGGQPVLGGHIMKKLHGKYGSERQIQRWSTVENTKNDFPPVSHYRVKKFYKVLQGRWIHHLTFEESYKVLAHSTNPIGCYAGPFSCHHLLKWDDIHSIQCFCLGSNQQRDKSGKGTGRNGIQILDIEATVHLEQKNTWQPK